jgi:hypothetical protein
MTKLDKHLDKLFQIKALEYYKKLGLSGELIHHHKQGRTNAIRYYIPCGVPLTAEAHNSVHAGDGKEIIKAYTEKMKKIWGEDWEEMLSKRKQLIVKADGDKIIKYLNGEIKDYINGGI